MNPRWPLHPVPDKYETLIRWLERTAAAYGVSMAVFCRHALGVERQEMCRLDSTDPPIAALFAIEAGSGIPIEQLQDMTHARVFARIWADLEDMMKLDPEAFARMVESMKRASQPGD